jgi:hypothetical protein
MTTSYFYGGTLVQIPGICSAWQPLRCVLVAVPVLGKEVMRGGLVSPLTDVYCYSNDTIGRC